MNQINIDEIKLKFGQKVRDLRLQKGISQEELGYRSGLHRNYISDIERGKRNISLENIFLLAYALDVAGATLLDFNE